MARNPKPLRRERARSKMLGRESCGICMCCPCNRVACKACPDDGRRKGESVKDYTRRWITDLYRNDPFRPSKHRRKRPLSE